MTHFTFVGRRIKKFTKKASAAKKIPFAIKLVAMLLAGLSINSALQIAQAGVPGQYKGIKLPFAAGQTRQVTGTHDRANGRHAIDFGMKLEDVPAMRGGVVRTATWDSSGGGNMLVIDHGDKDDFCSVYLHLNKFYVSPGQTVQQGQVVAQSGNTGSYNGQALPYHLHASVTQKDKGVCSPKSDQEIAMIFDEKPTGELNYPESVTSQNVSPNTSPPSNDTSFVSPSSKLTISLETIDLLVSAANLAGKTVYVQMWRDAANGYGPKEWSFNKPASGNSITFNDMDGPGNTFTGVTYYTVTSLSPIPSGEAAKKRTACFSATGGKYLCDAVRR